ncbi:MAG: DUF502 domain-containing protein [Proteobacteria bacterium]|nr:DUF502 domain-containing protein [Pseudomonadota bacterium]
MTEKVKKSLLTRLRNNFIAGAIVLIPIGITVYLSLFIIKILSAVLPKQLDPNNYLPFNVPGLEILITIILITVIGGISVSFLGKKALELFNNLLKKIPLLRTVYSAVTQLTESFTQSKGNAKSVVLVEFPRKGIWVIGFATSKSRVDFSKITNEDLVNVFVPTTPNPTSGFLIIVPKKDLFYIEMTFEQASRFIVSAGTSQ